MVTTTTHRSPKSESDAPRKVEGSWRRTFRTLLRTRVVRMSLGILFLVLGVVGLFVPFLQGILFLAIAALFLAPDVPIARRAVIRSFRRWPKIRKAVPHSFRKLGRKERN